jgi:hypothetical protein
MGEEKMSTIFNIGSQQAGRDIIQGNNLILSQSSPASEALKVIKIIKNKVDESDIDVKNKRAIGNHLDKAMEDLKFGKIDKESVADTMKKTNEILKEAKTTGETLRDIGVLIGKVVTWLGLI